MADLTRHDMQIITEHDHYRDTMIVEHLGKLGIQLRIAHFTGDSSYPTEYTLRYSFVSAVGPTLDLAIAEFVEKLLKFVDVENAEAKQEKPPDENAQKVAEYNRQMDERNRIAFENREKPWLPLHDE